MPRELVIALRRSMRGAVHDDTRRRAEFSSDAGNYRVVPRVVVDPVDADDVVSALDVGRSLGVPVTCRGAGTSIAGNAVGPGIVLDLGRRLSRALDIDPDARTAVVEPGVVLSDLQRRLAPHGMRFGPDPSSQDRCTLGGMIGNNACGVHAVSYGRAPRRRPPGHRPRVRACCGLTWITTGQLTAARRRLVRLLHVFEPYVEQGMSIVGLEPSCTAVPRSDLLDLLPDDPRAERVAAATRTLADALTAAAAQGWHPPALTGLELIAQPHCHQHAVMGFATDRALLQSMGATVTTHGRVLRPGRQLRHALFRAGLISVGAKDRLHGG